MYLANKVPMMFRAQTNGRCQLQRIQQEVSEQDCQRWAKEWVEKADSQPPEFGNDVQVKSYEINWRVVTNGGQDDGIVRPVIGARGYPYYPGTSMKGAFRRACTQQQAERYCGYPVGNGDYAPGILRFHGGYPANNNWQTNLVDLVHPQQKRQVKDVKDNEGSRAFAQISLYQPTLKFGISSTIPLEDSEWETIWQIWEKALSAGIGCRVSAGYGQPKQKQANLSYQPRLKGQGMASQLLNGEGEFRPNMFKAALRGHALRLFGGLTTPEKADSLVDQLFGGVKGQGTVGLLGVTFQTDHLELDEFGRGPFRTPTYDVEGQLCFSLTQSLSKEKKKALQKVVKALTRFAMVFGGFGKSWRRADHRLFFQDYYEHEEGKPLIGCHWQWSGEASQLNNTRYGLRNLNKLSSFIEKVRNDLSEWMQLQGITPDPNHYAQQWREAWHPEKVQVWGRIAEDAEDSRAIEWFHQPYRRAIPEADIPEGNIKQSSLTGYIGQIGRIWHRMYPRIKLLQNKNDPNDIKIKPTSQYFELLTIFPSDKKDDEDEEDDDYKKEKHFLDFLEQEQQQKQDMFTKLWGN